MTSHWPNRVFCFLLALTMGNIQNAGCYFANLPKVDALTSRKLIAQQLIENKYHDKKVRENNWHKRRAHEHTTQLPKIQKFVHRHLQILISNSGFALARLIKLDPTAPALKVSFGVSNVIQNILLMLKMSSM